MPKVEAADEFIKQQLEGIRGRLQENVSDAELRTMQLKIDVLVEWARLAADEYHNHDHMDDHDHSLAALPNIAIRSTETRER